jgi:hypothetical protein
MYVTRGRKKKSVLNCDCFCGIADLTLGIMEQNEDSTVEDLLNSVAMKSNGENDSLR